MKKLGFLITLFLATTLQAGVSSNVSRLLDSYLVAKADIQQPSFTDEQVKGNPYTIQVASYINEKDAVSHVEELKLQEKDVMYFPAFVRGQVWFKVCVGRFEKKDGAENYRRQFTKRMDEPFAIVISLLDRPTQDAPVKDAPTKNVAKAEKSDRDPASEHKEHKDDEGTDHMQVKLIPKNSPEVSAAKVSAVVHADEAKHGHEQKAVKHASPETHTVVTKNGEHFYSVQVGAYPNETAAKENIAQLPTKGHEAYYKMAVVNGKTWYRILVGRFTTRREAEEFQKFFAEQARGAESFIRRITASE